MSNPRFEAGLKVRRRVLGDQYVEAKLEHADSFNAKFQELVTEYCWGVAWADDTLEPKMRSYINLSMIAALNRMHEWKLHFKGALQNGATKEELQAVLIQISIYSGIPTGVECFRIANEVFEEMADASVDS